MQVTMLEVLQIVKDFPSAKSSGLDTLNGESLKYAHPLLCLLFTIGFTCMFKHCYIPQCMINSVIIPLIKNKCGDQTDKNNYRPIALSSIISKVFEHIISFKLIYKLIVRKVPLLIVRMFIFWYSKQEMCIKWGQSTSSFFTVSNGVRQGGILSPRLFSVYVDDLSKHLHDARSGCFIGHQCINHVMYADDICLLAPSALGLQKLLEMCYCFSQDNDIIF